MLDFGFGKWIIRCAKTKEKELCVSDLFIMAILFSF
jgi:hypothetical protein